MHKEYTPIRRFYAIVGAVVVWGGVIALIIGLVQANNFIDTALAIARP